MCTTYTGMYVYHLHRDFSGGQIKIFKNIGGITLTVNVTAKPELSLRPNSGSIAPFATFCLPVARESLLMQLRRI